MVAYGRHRALFRPACGTGTSGEAALTGERADNRVRVTVDAKSRRLCHENPWRLTLHGDKAL